MQDAQQLLEKEPDNAQAKALKLSIRTGKFEMEKQRKQRQRNGNVIPESDLPSVYDPNEGEEQLEVARGHAPGSVFQGFPKLSADEKSPTTSADTARSGILEAGSKPSPRLFETVVSRDIAGDIVAAHRDIGAQTHSKEAITPGYSFLNPSWAPPEEEDGALAFERRPPAALSTPCNTTAIKASPSQTQATTFGGQKSSGSSSGTVGGGSFAALLGKARVDRKAAKGGDASESKVEVVKSSKVVVQSMADLQELEQQAAQRVGETLRRQEGAANERGRHHSNRLAQKSAEFEQEQQRLRAQPVVQSAWQDLLIGESAAQAKFRQQTTGRKGS